VKHFAFPVITLLALLVSIVPLAAQETTECEAGFQLIVHELDETCVSEDVQRVVTLELSMTEVVVTLGVQPVGVADVALYNSLVNLPIPLSEDAVDVGSRSEPNLEVIAGLEPDLIVAASWRVGENYDELSAIAPTITFVGSESVEIMSEYFTTIAVALGREEVAEEILASMHEHFAAASEIIAASDVSPNFVLSLTWYEDSIATFRLYTDNGMPGEILNLIGLENTWDGENIDGYDVVGIEALGDFENTNFFFITDPDSESFYEESPLWNALPFVVAGTAFRLNDDLSLFGGPISAQRMVNAVLEVLELEVPEIDYGAELEVEEPEPTAEATEATE
jgi:ABC-type Fe3+-hydroxamate transport system substrate-binding protein